MLKRRSSPPRLDRRVRPKPAARPEDGFFSILTISIREFCETHSNPALPAWKTYSDITQHWVPHITANPTTPIEKNVAMILADVKTGSPETYNHFINLSETPDLSSTTSAKNENNPRNRQASPVSTSCTEGMAVNTESPEENNSGYDSERTITNSLNQITGARSRNLTDYESDSDMEEEVFFIGTHLAIGTHLDRPSLPIPELPRFTNERQPLTPSIFFPKPSKKSGKSKLSSESYFTTFV